MDLSKIKTLIEFVGQSNITELTVSEKDTTVRIFKTRMASDGVTSDASKPDATSETDAATLVHAPLYGVLHAAPAPGKKLFVTVGDRVEAGQTLFIIEAMKVFNTIVAPRAGRIVRVAAVDGFEVDAGDLLAEIA